jgi:hypothetical protein
VRCAPGEISCVDTARLHVLRCGRSWQSALRLVSPCKGESRPRSSSCADDRWVPHPIIVIVEAIPTAPRACIRAVLDRIPSPCRPRRIPARQAAPIQPSACKHTGGCADTLDSYDARRLPAHLAPANEGVQPSAGTLLVPWPSVRRWDRRATSGRLNAGSSANAIHRDRSRHRARTPAASDADRG